MTENEAIERLKCMRLFMEINHRNSENKFLEDDYIANNMAIKALEEIQQYRSIGTVSECREAVEKQRGKKPIDGKVRKCVGYYQCPACGGLLTTNKGFCEDCGQAISWERDNE